MEFFQNLGSFVEERWKDRNYDEELFPEIAAEVLVENAPYKQINPWEIIRWLNSTTHLPEQHDVPGMFGNPPITLYDGPRFHIDVYYWLDGTTSIHQHGFCGAFQVLLGSSLLSRYCFENEHKIGAHFSTGQIVLKDVELLGEGDIREILPGRQYIHSLFHLERPSATVVIRTHQTPSALPQYDFRKPYLAVDPFYKEAAMIKRVQSAALLLNMKHPNADEIIGEALGCSDFQTCFSILELAYNILTHNPLERSFGLTTGQQRFDALLGIARRRHGELVDLILPSVDEAHRQHNLIQRRSQITSNEHRFFLALLLNVPDRVKMLDLVRQRFPEQDPVQTVTDWLEELANTKMAGSPEPNVLGIDNFDDDYLFVFQCMLEGKTIEQTRIAFEIEYAADHAIGAGKKPEDLYDSIRNSMLFRSIFSDSPSAVTVTQSLSH